MEVREPALAYNQQKISIEEYLEMENASPEKHEYYQGVVFAMSHENCACEDHGQYFNYAKA